MALTVDKKKKRVKPIEVVPDNPKNRTLSKADFVAQEETRKDIDKQVASYAKDLKDKATKEVTKKVEAKKAVVAENTKLQALQDELAQTIADIKEGEEAGNDVSELKKSVVSLKMRIGKEKKK